MRYLILFSSVLIICLINSCTKDSIETKGRQFPEAEKQNIDENQLITAFNNAAKIVDLQGLAVARNSVIVAEEYFSESGPGPDPNLHVMSVTKSISSTLIGIAIDEDYIQSVQQTLSDFFGAEIDTINPELGNVTLHQLLTMTCGHGWQEIGPVSEFGDFVNAPDQLIYIFEKPIVNTPGTIFNYSDGAAHLCSAVIEKATGMQTSTFAKQYLFEPMGLSERVWYADNRMIAYGGVGLCIGIHDMIDIGYLYLNRGVFNGKQIVSAEWIDKATNPMLSTNNAIPFLTSYGYYWWTGTSHGHDYICANGYGGQFILISKELNLVVCSRTNYRGFDAQKAGENWYNVLNIIINEILPAVKA